MIIPDNSIQGTQAAVPARLVSNDGPVAVAAAPAQAAPQPPSPTQLQNAVDSINQAMRQSNQNLEFSVDPSTKTPVVRMVDKETGKLITQFPSEAVLAIADSIDQYLNQHQLHQGLLLKQKA